MPTVVTKAEIDNHYTSAPDSRIKGGSLHSDGVASIGRNLYDGAPGPWELHTDSDQIYFVRVGSGARALLDGRILEAKETSPGQIRGTGAVDAREYKIGAGDMVFVPRNTLHCVAPGSGKFGYLLLTVRN